MARIITVLYGALAYLIFLFTILYAVGFVGNLAVPKSIDTGTSGPGATAALIDLALLSLFAAQHSVMARPGFKRIWTRLVPPSAERSTYVLLASALLLLLFSQWRPIPTPVWTVATGGGALTLGVVFWLGWALVLTSTFLISHFELFGLTQVIARLRGRELPAPQFRTPLFYRYVRHPIYVGFLLAFWATPAMTVGHLLFAVATSGYILLGIWLEERDLIALFGNRYRQYREQVGMLIPRLVKRQEAKEPRRAA